VNALRHFLLAVQFFTRVPVTGRLADWVGYSPEMLRASAAWYPVVGLVVGAVGAGVAWALLQVLPPVAGAPFAAAALSTAVTVLFTGAFHEDGLADVADGLGGSLQRERALQIMKDSRIGAFGAIAMVLGLACKLGLLAVIAAADAQALVAALLLGHALSRYWPLLIVRELDYVGEANGSKAKPIAESISNRSLLVASACTLLVLACGAWQLGPLWVAAAVLLSGLAWRILARWLRRRLQGFTGDCLGAVQQVCEIACYLGIAVTL